MKSKRHGCDGELCTFIRCSLVQLYIRHKTVVISDGITSIGDSVFRNSSNFTSIVIPDSVASIGKYAFFGCFRFSYVYYRGSTEKWDLIKIGTQNDEIHSAEIIYKYADVNRDGAIDQADLDVLAEMI